MTPDADTLLELEQLIAQKAMEPFSKPFATLLALLLSIWPGDEATQADKQKALNRINIEIFMGVASTVEQTILAGTTEAFVLGVSVGLGPSGGRSSAFKRTLPIALATQVSTVTRTMRTRVDTGAVVLSQATTLVEAQAGLMVANPASAVGGHARWLTNRASNEGIVRVAESDPDSVLVWVAERDACVHCLAYQGHVRREGKYPMGLTFGSKPLSDKPVPMPPLHPNCRCTQMVLASSAAGPVIAGLLREAKRSVLRGWSVESESNSVRVDAARRLLAKSPSMPKSVQAYARSAVKAGKFKRGRGMPV